MWRILLLLPFLPPGDAFAYSPRWPTRHDVPSDNGAFVLDVDPKAKRLAVYAAANRDQPLWSFNREVWQEGHFLSNDGNVVAVVAWRFVTVDGLDRGVCVEFWDKGGKFQEYTFAELCPRPARIGNEPGPEGSFWRKWYADAEGDGVTLRISTTDRYEYVFAMEDGRILQTRLRPFLRWGSLAYGTAVIGALGFFWWLLVRLRRNRHEAEDGHAGTSPRL